MLNSVTAKKSLGQSFLVERSYAARIAAALGIQRGETVLEIGPGRGILTSELLEAGARTVAIEIDQRLIDSLRRKFAASPHFELRHEDFLDTNFREVITDSEAKVAGNLPYHLVAQVIFRLLEHVRLARDDSRLPWIKSAVLMMQKEVADRVAASPGSKTFGRISVFTQLESRVTSLFSVPAGAFQPRPKVDGGVVLFEFYRMPQDRPRDFATLERMVRYCFHQRRKMLKSTLSSLPGIHPYWKEANFDFTRRPETLSPAEWVMLADTVTSARVRRASP